MKATAHLSAVAEFSFPRLQSWMSQRYPGYCIRPTCLESLGEALKPAVRDSGEMIDYLGLPSLVESLNKDFGMTLFLDTPHRPLAPLYQAAVRRFSRQAQRAFEFTNPELAADCFCRELEIVPLNVEASEARTYLAALRVAPDLMVTDTVDFTHALAKLAAASATGHKVIMTLQAPTTKRGFQMLRERCTDAWDDGQRVAASLMGAPAVIVFKDEAGKLRSTRLTEWPPCNEAGSKSVVDLALEKFDAAIAQDYSSSGGCLLEGLADSKISKAQETARRARLSAAADQLIAFIHKELSLSLKKAKGLELLAHLLGQPDWNTLVVLGPAGHLLQTKAPPA